MVSLTVYAAYFKNCSTDSEVTCHKFTKIVYTNQIQYILVEIDF